VCSDGRDGDINSKYEFVTLNKFVHESRRDFIAFTNSNTVQPQACGRPALFLRVKMVVHGADQRI